MIVYDLSMLSPARSPSAVTTAEVLGSAGTSRVSDAIEAISNGSLAHEPVKCGEAACIVAANEKKRLFGQKRLRYLKNNDNDNTKVM